MSIECKRLKNTERTTTNENKYQWQNGKDGSRAADTKQNG